MMQLSQTVNKTFHTFSFKIILYIYIYIFCFSRLHPQHMEVPRLGAESELHLPAYTRATAMQDPRRICDLHHLSRGKAGSPTHWARPRIEPAFLWILVGFVTTEPPREFPKIIFLKARTQSHAILKVNSDSKALQKNW